MLRAFLKFTLLCFFVCLGTTFVYAQSSVSSELEWPIPDYSDECLGIHCYISVDFNNDFTESGYLKYTITQPREGADFIQGPVSSYLLNKLGSTVDVYVHRSQLELTLADMSSAQVPFALFVNLWKDSFGNTSTNPNNESLQCYYYVVFNINTLQ